MKIINNALRDSSIMTAIGSIQFNENGVADVEDEFAVQLLELRGYEAVNDDFKTEDETAVIDSNNNCKESLKDSLDKMNVMQLKKYAKDNEINTTASKKTELIAEIIEHK